MSISDVYNLEDDYSKWKSYDTTSKKTEATYLRFSDDNYNSHASLSNGNVAFGFNAYDEDDDNINYFLLLDG